MTPAQMADCIAHLLNTIANYGPPTTGKKVLANVARIHGSEDLSTLCLMFNAFEMWINDYKRMKVDVRGNISYQHRGESDYEFFANEGDR